MAALYERLAETDIRLVTANARDGAVASLKLRTYPRTAAPEYDAVSYAWGDDTLTTSVMCNGVPLAIRTNLFVALPYLHASRPEPRTRPLWIDAICLNQDDHDEKAMHVPIMAEVFKNATRTLAWLGEADCHSDRAIDRMESWTQMLVRARNLCRLGAFRGSTHDGDRHWLHAGEWKSLTAFQSRSWFTRLWILQEIVLSKEAVLLCGCRWVSWDALVALNQTFESIPLDLRPSLPRGYTTSRNRIKQAVSLRLRHKPGCFIMLSSLLNISYDRGYTEPVDRVWALLGLLDKNDQQIIRDVGKSWEKGAAKAHE